MDVTIIFTWQGWVAHHPSGWTGPMCASLDSAVQSLCMAFPGKSFVVRGFML